MAYITIHNVFRNPGKEVYSFLKKVRRLLAGTGAEHHLLLKNHENIRITLNEKCSRKAIWNTFRILSFVFSKEREEHIDFSDVLDGYGIYSCGHEVYGFSTNFDGVWDPEWAMDFVARSMEEIYTEGGEISFGIDFVNFTVSMKVEYSEICDDCAAMPGRVAWFKENMRPDTLLQGSIYSHGLATGFGVNEVSAEKAEENLKTLLDLVGSNKEICCSWKTQQIGGFGLFVRGEVTIASSKDLWSYVGRNGSREFNVDENYEYIIDRKEDLDFSLWDHTEFFVKPKEVIAFWAKDWFVRDVPGGRELVEKFRQRGYRVYITRRRHR